MTECPCGCRTGEDADRSDCGCDCHDPDSPNYRELPEDAVEAYSDDENERGALRQFMDEGASFEEAVAMLNGFDVPTSQASPHQGSNPESEGGIGS